MSNWGIYPQMAYIILDISVIFCISVMLCILCISHPLPYLNILHIPHIQQIFYPYLHFCAENVILAVYELSNDEDQDDQPGQPGPHQPPPGVPSVGHTGHISTCRICEICKTICGNMQFNM
jgi:hypothetical protein